MRRTSCLPIVWIACAGLWAAHGGPDLVPVSQTRSISGIAFADDGFGGSMGDSQSDQAPDFAPFQSAVAADAIVDTAIGSGGGQQDSTILADGIVATGALFANAEVWDFGAYADASATNLVRVTFQIASELSYLLQGELSAFDSAETELSLRDGANQELFGVVIEGTATTLPVDEAGVLSPGEYTLEVRTAGNVSGFDFDSAYSTGEFDISFHVMPVVVSGGEVPDGDDVPGAMPLLVDKLSGGDVRLRWSSSCRAADDDFIVYEGDLSNPGDLVPVTCSTVGLLEWDVVPAFDGAFYLVVPTDGITEGSYGDTSSGAERQPSALACFTQMLSDPVCP